MILIYMLQPKTTEHNWLAKTLFGVLLVTVSKVCGAQVCQEKGSFSTVHLRLNLGKSVTVFKDRRISLSSSQSPKPVQVEDLQYFGSDQLQHTGILDPVPNKRGEH